ncbi:hypothetical protein OHN37_07520 [Streptomyces sp. NBC_00485]|uniref:hypothetical protein n=1 Tax=Streptomyces sp. NBC_00485 TaxID=2975758 RepID=UPI002E17C6D1
MDLAADDAQDLAEDIDGLERDGTDLSLSQRTWCRITRILTSTIASAAAAGSEQAGHEAIVPGSQLFSRVPYQPSRPPIQARNVAAESRLPKPVLRRIIGSPPPRPARTSKGTPDNHRPAT